MTLAEGQTAEVNLDAGEWLRRAAASIGRGFVVTVDYGDDAAGLYGAPHRREGTLRAFRRHALTQDVLGDPGEQDLTTTVNWTQLVIEGETAGLKTLSLERLDAFLLRAGLVEQLELESARAATEADVDDAPARRARDDSARWHGLALSGADSAERLEAEARP